MMNDTEPSCERSKSAPVNDVESQDSDQDDVQRHDKPAHSRDDGGDETGRSGDTADRPREIGGRKGPDPVRYGDWEKNGRCIDF